jgi:hypothetical protein
MGKNVYKCQLCFHEGTSGNWLARDFYRCADCGVIQCGNCREKHVIANETCGSCSSKRIKMLS